jgi:hypothetical protein
VSFQAEREDRNADEKHGNDSHSLERKFIEEK